MRNNLEDYLLAVIKGEKTGFAAKLVLILLSILEVIYIIGIKLREVFYKIGIFQSESLACKVISVGNITTGGTGKTPLVERLACDLKKKGKKVVVISRGYRSQGEGPLVVSDGKEILTDVKQAGDELFMLAHNLDEIPVIKGKDRLEAGRLALEKFSPDIILLDDSFQHWQLERDIDIVVIDALNPFGYNHLIPRGLLREPLSSLKRADLVFITKSHHLSRESLSEIKNKIKSYNSKAKIINTAYKPLHLEQMVACSSERELSSPEQLANERVLALSGIGNPASFTQSLKDLKAEVVATLEFPDHYNYCKEDVTDIAVKAQMNNANFIITTDKDAVKFDQKMLASFNKMDIGVCSLGIELEFAESVYPVDEVLRLLKQ